MHILEEKKTISLLHFFILVIKLVIIIMGLQQKVNNIELAIFRRQLVRNTNITRQINNKDR